MSMAYWGPKMKVGVPQPALNIDMDAHTNVESLSFSFDSERKNLPVVVHPGADHQGADPDPDPGHRAAQPAARR